MWALNNTTPFAAACTWQRDKDGAHVWIIAIRATFDLLDEGSTIRLADEQPEPTHLPEFRGDETLSSLRRDLDLGPPKPTTDVLIHGRAHAPGGAPAREVPIGVRYGDVNKVLVARGTNVYYDGPLGPTTTRPDPFTTMPVVYERAYGGQDWRCEDLAKRAFDARNPVGVGFAPNASDGAPRLGPNIVYPGGSPAKDGPAGFGPIASHWSPRCGYAGTYDAAWVRDRKPLLPRDYDDRFALCAPEDQRQADPLRSGTVIEVVNMTLAGVLRLELPEVELRLTTQVGGKRVEHAASLATVDVDLEGPAYQLSLTWQSCLEVGPRQVAQLDETKIEER